MATRNLVVCEQQVILPILVPFVSPDKLADLWTPGDDDLVGDIRPILLASTRVRIINQASDGILPSFHIGKRLVINIAQLAQRDALAVPGVELKLEFSVLVSTMTMEVFAQHTGFELGVVAGWLKRGYIPSNKHGSYRMINIIHMLDRCLNWSPNHWSALVERTSPTQPKPVHLLGAV